MEKYDNYKNSNSPWIREMPSHWEIKKIKHLLIEERDALKTGPFGSQLKSSDLSLSGTYKVYTQRNILDKDAKIGSDYIDYDKFQDLISFEVYPKDILFTTRGTIGKCYQLPIDIEKGVLHPCVIRIQIKEDILLYKWLEYYVNDTNSFISNVKSESNSTIIDVIYGGTLKEIKIPLPPLTEQQTIATYLDHKTAEIDDLIQTKKTLIEKYKEHKNAIINQAVTKGIVDGVEMKDSGIEWLGEIPKHWEVKKLKYHGEAIMGIIYSPNDVVQNSKEGVLVLRSSNIQNGKLAMDNCVFVDKEISEKQTVQIGDILLCSRNGSRRLIGKNICIDERTAGNTFGAFMTVYRTEDYHFVYWYFNSQVFKGLSGLFLTSTINQLTIGTLNNFEIALPPKEEQQAIVNHIKTKTNLIDQKIAIATEAVTLLEEYRTALISDVVTGKIKISNQ